MSPTKRQGAPLQATMATLARMKINALRAAYARTTGKPANRLGRDVLIKTLAARADDTSPAAEAPTAARPPGPARGRERDPRLPGVGGTIEKVFKGKLLRVQVTADGFRHAGKDWPSLTALALSITGYKAISGPAFFGIAKPTATPPAKATRTAKPKAKGA